MVSSKVDKMTVSMITGSIVSIEQTFLQFLYVSRNAQSKLDLSKVAWKYAPIDTTQKVQSTTDIVSNETVARLTLTLKVLRLNIDKSAVKFIPPPSVLTLW